jgi:phosphate starvation-inducible protein PhoH
MNCHSRLLPYDVFFADKTCDFSDKNKHYYVCIYTQELDTNNVLFNDVYGLMITTNQKYNKMQNDYNVEIMVNGRRCYVNCDKMIRLQVDEKVTIKQQRLSQTEIKEIKINLNKFLEEVKRQSAIKEVI